MDDVERNRESTSNFNSTLNYPNGFGETLTLNTQ